MSKTNLNQGHHTSSSNSLKKQPSITVEEKPEEEIEKVRV